MDGKGLDVSILIDWFLYNTKKPFFAGKTEAFLKRANLWKKYILVLLDFVELEAIKVDIQYFV